MIEAAVERKKIIGSVRGLDVYKLSFDASMRIYEKSNWMKITSAFSLCLLTWKEKPTRSVNNTSGSSFVKRRPDPNYMNNYRWNKVRELENRYKEKSLRRMSRKESIDIFLNLYQFSQKMPDKKHCTTFDSVKIGSLIRIHSLANKVRQ
jgi:hypothetical protein